MRATINLILLRALVLIMMLGYYRARYLLIDIDHGIAASVSDSDRTNGILWLGIYINEMKCHIVPFLDVY